MTYRDDIPFEESIFDDWSGASRIEMPLSRGPYFFVGLSAFVLAVAFLGRVFFLDTVRGDAYAARSTSNVDKEFSIPAYRGVISDRSGVPLVTNVPSFNVSIDLGELYRARTPSSVSEALISRVAEILGEDPDLFRVRVRSADFERGSRIVVARDATSLQVIELRALSSDAVVIEDDYRREYADPRIFSAVLGYTAESGPSGSRAGAVGLEAAYDALLRGEDGVRVVYRDARGTALQEKRLREPRPGVEIRTTIDAEFQRYFHARFAEGLASLGKTSGAGIAMNPKTGEILALLSFPSFDNTRPADYLADPARPLFNRAVSGVYSPASTIKPLVGLAALREKLITPAFSVYSPGYLELPNPYDPERPSRFLDWQPQGTVNLYSALARSSNVFFYVVGGGCTSSACNDVGRNKGLGIRKLNEYWKLFGLDRKTGIDLTGEAEGFLPDAEEKEERTGVPWRIGDTYNVSIGQGDLGVTPIRLITFFSSLGNYGVTMKPHLLFGIPPEKTIDYSSWADEIAAVRQGVRDVVAKPYGTASRLFDLPYKTSGKTGSAQIANNAKTNAFFLGYGPSDSPELAVLILIEDAKTGSLNAVPIGRDVMKWYYDHRL